MTFILFIQLIGCVILHDEFSEFLKMQRNDSIHIDILILTIHTIHIIIDIIKDIRYLCNHLIFYIQIIGCGVLYDEFSEYLKIQRNDSIHKLTCIRMIDIFNQLLVLNSYDEYYLKAWQIYRYFVTEGMYICTCYVIFYWSCITLLFDFILYFCHLG
jgi:hypothetical protein